MGRHFAALWVPAGALLFTGCVVYLLSRVLLSFNRETTPIAAIVIATAILIVGALLGVRMASEGETS